MGVVHPTTKILRTSCVFPEIQNDYLANRYQSPRGQRETNTLFRASRASSHLYQVTAIWTSSCISNGNAS
ncbi:hypothetical protein M433DRAFT_169578 [Acidomyces richmondensis BFW]|nr:hypothetical protein M433DRAFT_169578 [Acidomyces richmondensis BFW]